MCFNTLLARFGFDSSNFVNKTINTIEYENGCKYEVEERFVNRIIDKLIASNDELLIKVANSYKK